MHMNTEPTCDELEIMCLRAVLNLKKVRVEKDLKDYTQLFKYITPVSEPFPKLLKIVERLVKDLNEINEELNKAI